MTSKASSRYRRAVLGLGTGSIDRHMLRAAGEFARLLELEMLGLFIEDRSLLGLAALPFSRELRLPGHDWQTLEPQRVGDELRAAAEQAQRLFRQEIASQGVACRFEVRAGDPGKVAGDVAQTGDILIVAEPMEIEALASASTPARRAALSSAAAVLLLPRSGMPQRGPVAAVASGPAGACFELASRIAESAGEEAVTVPGGLVSTATLMRSLQHALGPHRERLLILPRSASMHDDVPQEIASLRKVPVLIVGAEEDQPPSIA
ncbi:MAG: hypothetical protein U1E21_00220 [Reyranellaceae bacterium]